MCPQVVPSRLLSTPYFLNPTAIDIRYDFYRSEASNYFLLKSTKKREEESDILERLIEIRLSGETDSWRERVDIENKLEGTWKPWDLGALLPIVETISPRAPSGKPLRACILAIMWELAQLPRHQFLLSKEFLSLLSSAACYQATSPGVSSRRLFPTIMRSLSIYTG
jgi:hypothetical protein